MRIHFTLPLTGRSAYQAAYAALDECKKAGAVAEHVSFKALTEHRSGGPGFMFALEVQLEAAYRDRGRRAGSSGSYGAMSHEYDNYAATYDEWGFFLAALYRMDGAARCAPNFKRDSAVYYDADDFHFKTGRTYDATYPDYVENYGDEFPFRAGRNQVGRRGSGRLHVDSPHRRMGWAIEDDRSAAYLRDLHTGLAF